MARSGLLEASDRTSEDDGHLTGLPQLVGISCGCGPRFVRGRGLRTPDIASFFVEGSVAGFGFVAEL